MTARPLLASLTFAAALVAGVAGASASADDVDRGLQTPKGPLVFTVVIDGLDGDAVDAGSAPFISSLLAGKGAKRRTSRSRARSCRRSRTRTTRR